MEQYKIIREFEKAGVPTTGLDIYVLGDHLTDTLAQVGTCSKYMFNGVAFVPLDRTGSVALSGETVYNLDAECVNSFFIELHADSIIHTPTNLMTGDVGMIYVGQGLSGGHEVTWGDDYLFPDDLPVLTVSAFSQSVFKYRVLLNGKLVMEYIESLGD